MNWAIIQQVVIMALLAGVGFACRKLALLDESCTKKLSTIVLNFSTPMVILVSYQKPFDPDTLNTLMISFLIAIISYVIAFVLVPLIVRSKNKDGQVVERFSCLYSNCAFMGIPLIQGVYGADGVFCLTAYVTMFNLCAWTHGVVMMKGGKPNIKQLLKSLLSPCIIITVLGIILFLCNFTLPSVILETAQHLAVINTPLAMMIAGSTIATVKLIPALKKPRLYYTCFVKLILLPALLMAICLIFRIDTTIAGVNILATACPAAAMCTMFSLLYDRDAGYSAEIFAVSTILSMVTLPLTLVYYTALAGIFM